jgi:hypothetical protein
MEEGQQIDHSNEVMLVGAYSLYAKPELLVPLMTLSLVRMIFITLTSKPQMEFFRFIDSTLRLSFICGF